MLVMINGIARSEAYSVIRYIEHHHPARLPETHADLTCVRVLQCVDYPFSSGLIESDLMNSRHVDLLGKIHDNRCPPILSQFSRQA